MVKSSDCDTNCVAISCLSEWWRNSTATSLSVAAVLVFFATFLPRILVRLVIFTLTKLPFIRQTAYDFRVHCTGTSAYLISASLVLLALSISELEIFFCNFPRYIWGIFFLAWLYSLFNVVECGAIRRFGRTTSDASIRTPLRHANTIPLDLSKCIHDTSRHMVISESVKIFRLTTLLIIALIIYSSILGDRELLKYSVLGVIGIAIALGFVPSFHNVVGGLFLAFNSQLRLDDFIKIGHTKGFVHQVRLRYTTIITVEGTEVYVPNSFFLYKPMINYSQRPKRDLDIIVHVAKSTLVENLRACVQRIESMLQTLYIGITSHEENTLDQQIGEKWKHFSFVAMEELFALRIYCYVEELDFRKYAMIKSEVWLAIMEIMEELGIEVISKHRLDDLSHYSPFTDDSAIQHENSDVSESPFQSGLQDIVGIQRI